MNVLITFILRETRARRRRLRPESPRMQRRFSRRSSSFLLMFTEMIKKIKVEKFSGFFLIVIYVTAIV